MHAATMHSLSKSYAEKVERWSSSEQWLLEMQFFLSRNELCGAHVLDYGCGSGRAHLVAEKLGVGSYEGIDRNPYYRYGKLGPQSVTRCLSPGEGLPFEDGSFDVAFLFHVLPHLEKPVDALADVRRCVRRGGLLGIAVTNASYWEASVLTRWLTGYHEDPTVMRRHTMGTVRSLVEEFGRIRSAHAYGPRYLGFGPSLRVHVWAEVA
jgi:SAM-dependent methyltransferase